MGYNKKAYIQTKEIFKAREDRAREDAFMRKCEVEAAVPEIREINVALASTGADIAIELAMGSHNIEERINALRDKNLALQTRRAQLLVANGYPDDYLKPKFNCDKCEDSGFVGTRICDCFHREVVENTIRSSGIGGLVDKQSFETFDLKYYSQDLRTLNMMKGIYTTLKEYAEGFTPARKSVLMMGGTGLGKTHMSTAIAKTVIEGGYDVVYDTVQNILGDFEYERFGRGYNTDSDEKRTDKYFECDLLIMDDLGTELTNSFTVSCLYNLINTRINKHLPVIINTNLTHKELKERYEERITSRLMGEFVIMPFTGTDIRQQKMQ